MSYKGYKSFQKAVVINGSGVTSSGKILHYNNLKKPVANKCPDAMGSPTTIGARGRCLTPFLSIAGDASIYPIGTIIEVPSMRGKTVSLPPPGKGTMVHPGYFIMDDVGAAIKGANRFDFFTGTLSPLDPRNDFGNRQSKKGADRKMLFSDTHACNKDFNVISRRSPRYAEALAALNAAKAEGGGGTQILAYDPPARKRRSSTR